MGSIASHIQTIILRAKLHYFLNFQILERSQNHKILRKGLKYFLTIEK